MSDRFRAALGMRTDHETTSGVAVPTHIPENWGFSFRFEWALIKMLMLIESPDGCEKIYLARNRENGSEFFHLILEPVRVKRMQTILC